MTTAEEIRRQVEEFVAKGNKIEVIPFGVSNESQISKFCLCGCKGVATVHEARISGIQAAIITTRRGGNGKKKTKAAEGY